MADTRADQCRKNAEECRRQAGNSPKIEDKAAWLKMAGDWLKLAESLDSSAAKESASQIQTETLLPASGS